MSRITILALLISISISCTKDPDVAPVNASDKFITSLTISITSPRSKTITAVIDEANHTIVLPTGYYDRLNGIVSVAASPGATIWPDPASLSALTESTTFTITAIDGSQVEYHTVIDRSSVLMSSIDQATYEPNGTMKLTGTNLVNGYVEAQLKRGSVSHRMYIISSDQANHTYMTFLVPSTLEVADYTLALYYKDQNAGPSDPFLETPILFPTPVNIDYLHKSAVITSISKGTSNVNGVITYKLTMDGRYLYQPSAADLQAKATVVLVQLSNPTNKIPLQISSAESSEFNTYFTIRCTSIPYNIPSGEYALRITYNGATVTYGPSITFPF